MGLHVERIPTLRDNYTYLAICDETREAAIVDAPEEEPVVRRVAATGVTVTHILSTHHHADHSGANPTLAERYGAPVYGHLSDARRLPGMTVGIDEGDVIEVGRQRARVLFVPAHTRGHVAYVVDDAKVVFTGDMLFAAGCGRLFEGDARTMFASLCGKLAALPDDFRVYCGHEYTESNLEFAHAAEPENEQIRARLDLVRTIRARSAADWRRATPDEMTIPSTIGLEKATNPFLRAQTAEELGRLRQWKDRF